MSRELAFNCRTRTYRALFRYVLFCFAVANVSPRKRVCNHRPFQPPPSLRRATAWHLCQCPHMPDFNPRPPCGGRQDTLALSSAQDVISIHALLAEGDTSLDLEAPRPCQFQSTPSLRRATLSAGRPPALLQISIHALLAEGDCSGSMWLSRSSYFNPRPPCGGRLSAAMSTRSPAYFNPRPPCGGRPARSLPERRNEFYFNPRPPCGGRLSSGLQVVSETYFNPRPPCGGRRMIEAMQGGNNNISIHALLAEGDLRRC